MFIYSIEHYLINLYSSPDEIGRGGKKKSGGKKAERKRVNDAS